MKEHFFATLTMKSTSGLSKTAEKLGTNLLATKNNYFLISTEQIYIFISFKNVFCFRVMLDEWEDITEEFKNVTSKLGVGVLIHDKEFTLHDGMTAVEMMHPQMDIGSMRSQTRPVLSPG